MSMNRKMKKWIFMDILLLLLLFLASSTDLLMKEWETEVYKIAVLVDMPVKGQQENFRSGIMKASMKQHTDINFVNLSSVQTTEERQEILEKELQNGCQGIILHCEKTAHIAEIVEKVPIDIPVIVYNSESEAACIRGRIGSDIQTEYTLLAESILHNAEKEKGVTIVEMGTETERVMQIHEYLRQALEGAGVSVRLLCLENLSAVHAPIREASLVSGGIFVSADLSVLQEMGEANLIVGKKLPVYGVGFHAGIRKVMEEGGISASVVHRAYEAGYFSVDMVVKALNGKEEMQETIFVETALITAETMYTSEVESIVFPYL